MKFKKLGFSAPLKLRIL